MEFNNTTYSTSMGVDIAKNVIQVFSVNSDGVIKNVQVKRCDFLNGFKNREACCIGMEACSGSQHWARQLTALGHTVHLMHPKAVKPFVAGLKNDRNDARGIYTAMMSGVRRVPVKSDFVRDLDTLLTMRKIVMKGRTALINHVRGILAEYGIVMDKAVNKFFSGIEAAIAQLDGQKDVCRFIVDQLKLTLDNIRKYGDRINDINRQLDTLAKQSKHYEHFLEMPGVGKITAVVMCSLLADPTVFKNGRQFAAYLGLTPMSRGSGGHNVVTSIPRYRCDRDVRALLVQCAHAITHCKLKAPWVEKILKRKVRKVALIAIANRLARQLWARAVKGENWVPEALAQTSAD
jgi:transposase